VEFRLGYEGNKNGMECNGNKNLYWGQVLWLTPVILTIQEAEFRRIVVQSQQGQIVSETLSQKY
jgi:hypothetical protein